MFFKHFTSKNQLPGFYISGTLVENGLNVSDDYLTAEARSKYQTFVPRVEYIKNDEWVDAYLYVKQRIDSSM